MTLQAWNTCIWEVSPILLCRSSHALSGWIERIAAQLFSGLQRCLIGFKAGLWLGHSRTFRDLSQSLTLHCLGGVLRVVVLLEGEPSPQSEVLSTLGAGFHQGSLCTSVNGIGQITRKVYTFPQLSDVHLGREALGVV